MDCKIHKRRSEDVQEENSTELKEKVVAINRVAKVVKGGRNFRFSAVVVVGDGAGHVGVGNGKAAEVPDAIKKAIEDAKKNLVEVSIVDTTIPHEIIGKFGSASVMLKPASEGTGIIAGGSVRPVLELAGYRDIRTKIIGTNNPRNVVYATLEGLKSMQTVESVAKKRGKKVEEIGQILHLNKGSIATMCRRYREQGLEEYARNKYQSHRWLLNWEREEEILNQFNDGTGKQVTANEIKTVLDEACGKDTGRVYVYNVLKRHGWSKKMPRSRHPKAADEEACEASKKLNPVCWMPNPKTRPKLSD